MHLAQTTITLPDLVPTAAAVASVLIAAGLVGRYIVRPLVRAVRYVQNRLEEVAALVEQVREVVLFVGLFGGDVEARLDRIEEALGLGYWKPSHERRNPPTLHEQLAHRLATTAQIRDLGDDKP